MFAIVEMNGCILNLAIKKPAMDAKVVVSNTQTMQGLHGQVPEYR